ncbi:MAG: 16S rRNA processing protein RimM [Desulfamplus sp.]|nr:16S rRNA processing protein RimM [Desulfamplus sp.]
MTQGAVRQNSVDRRLITIGEITGVHGVKGYLKVRSFADSLDLFSPGIRLFLGSSENLDTEVNRGDWYNIVRVTPHKKGVIALFEGVTREIAEGLVGRSIAVDRDDLPELEPDTYYWEDLVGLKVTDIHSGYLGVIGYILPTGSNDVFVVQGSGKEILVPALEWVILNVDIEKGEMTIDLPEGLKD